MLVRKKKRKKREGEKKKKRNTGQSCTKYQLDKRDEIGMRMRWIRKKKKGSDDSWLPDKDLGRESRNGIPIVSIPDRAKSRNPRR